MTTLQFNRKVELQVAGLTITEPHISFTIDREASNTSLTGKVAISNLSNEHERRIRNHGTSVLLIAGYQHNYSLLANAKVQRSYLYRDGVEREIRLALDTATRNNPGTTTREYSEPESLDIIVRDLVRDLRVADPSIGIGQLDELSAISVPSWNWDGDTTKALTALLRGYGFDWFDDDGIVRVNRVGRPQPGNVRIFLSPETGLLGSPVLTDDGAEALSLLQPYARVGHIAELDSSTVTGGWKISGLKHRGDNRSAPFTTKYILKEIESSE